MINFTELNFTGFAFPNGHAQLLGVRTMLAQSTLPAQLLTAVQTPGAWRVGVFFAFYVMAVYSWTALEEDPEEHAAELVEFIEDGGKIVKNLMAKNEKLDAENAKLTRENTALVAQNASLMEGLASKKTAQKQLELARRALALVPRPGRALLDKGWRQQRTGRCVRVVKYSA